MARGRAAYLEARIAKLENDLIDELELQERFGDDKDYASGTVISWEQRFRGGASIAYTFVAIKVGGSWYTTSQFDTKRSWDTLVSDCLSKAEEGSVFIVSGWEAL